MVSSHASPRGARHTHAHAHTQRAQDEARRGARTRTDALELRARRSRRAGVGLHDSALQAAFTARPQTDSAAAVPPPSAPAQRGGRAALGGGTAGTHAFHSPLLSRFAPPRMTTIHEYGGSIGTCWARGWRRTTARVHSMASSGAPCGSRVAARARSAALRLFSPAQAARALPLLSVALS